MDARLVGEEDDISPPQRASESRTRRKPVGRSSRSRNAHRKLLSLPPSNENQVLRRLQFRCLRCSDGRCDPDRASLSHNWQTYLAGKRSDLSYFVAAACQLLRPPVADYLPRYLLQHASIHRNRGGTSPTSAHGNDEREVLSSRADCLHFIARTASA